MSLSPMPECEYHGRELYPYVNTKGEEWRYYHVVDVKSRMLVCPVEFCYFHKFERIAL
jgi:hypothetical protein